MTREANVALEAMWSRFKHWIDKDDPLERQVRAALAAAAREGGDVKQAPGEAPQSGGEAVTPNPGQEPQDD